jgi:hypothetical protein
MAVEVGNEARICQITITADRSAEEIVLMRLAPAGATAGTTKWRLTPPLGSASQLALASRGTRLHLAVSERLIRTFAFDWAKL